MITLNAVDDLPTRRAVQAMLHLALVTAQRERPARIGSVDTPTGEQIGWVVHERQVMADEVNRWRTMFGLPPIGVDLIEAAEQAAFGHINYTLKVTQGCTDLALGQPRSEDA